MKEVKSKNIGRRARQSVLKKARLPFTRTNYLFFALGLTILFIGYVAMAQPPADNFLSLTVAPILLVIGYCVVIPFAILYQKKIKHPLGNDKAAEQ